MSKQENQEEYLTEIFDLVASFYGNSCVPRHIDDVKSHWIISQEESDAFETVLGVLLDCGAQPSNLL